VPLSDLEPETLKRVMAFMTAAVKKGMPVRPVEPIFRTFAEQDELYAQGRTKLSTVGCKHPGDALRRPPGTCKDHPLGAAVTHAQGGQSFHNLRRAIDVIFLEPDGRATYEGDWEALAAIGESCGLEAGARWPQPKTDLDHFQFTGGMSLPEARAAFLAEEGKTEAIPATSATG
jgi:peptidoglycan L-alanyl-D-glutamate endopeptidase CwlK